MALVLQHGAPLWTWPDCIGLAGYLGRAMSKEQRLMLAFEYRQFRRQGHGRIMAAIKALSAAFEPLPF